MTNLFEVDWTSLPAPQDDGGANHLPGMRLPSITLAATTGERVDLARLDGRSVVYAYPMTGRPETPLPDDGWDQIPGARGCTPQSCAFRDHALEIANLGVQNLFGLSTQSTDYQREAVERLHLPFSLLSDADMSLTSALALPTFEVEQMVLIRRLTLIIDAGVVSKVIYPVFPPDQNAEMVIDWLKQSS